MIYSKQSDFLFKKGRKVSGTSMEIALSVLCGNARGRGPTLANFLTEYWGSGHPKIRETVPD
jgi:hypothetical protein